MDLDASRSGPLGPRERLLIDGAARLSDAELIAVLLGTGNVGEPALLLSNRLLGEVGGLNGLAQIGAGKLVGRRGIGPSKAARLLCAFELGKRLCSRELAPGTPLTSSRDVYEALRGTLALDRQETFWALALDARQRAKSRVLIARGGTTSCPVAVSDAFRPLLTEAACAVIFAHNHPSGNPSPSDADRELTARLVQAGELLGIRVLDHVIVAREGYFSFLDAGLLP